MQNGEIFKSREKEGELYVNSRALADYSLKFLHPS